jgi:8-oxo-dGTP diphosphatase
MIAEAMIVRDNSVLMVKEHVDRGDIVWNFPGGSAEESETPEQACIREVREETGYDIRIARLVCQHGSRYTYLADIIGGELVLEPGLIESAWVGLDDSERYDSVTTPALNAYLDRAG